MYAAQQILFLFIEPDFNQQVESIYVDFNTNEHQEELNTESTTIAARLDFLPDPDHTVLPDPDTIARVNFFTANKVDGGETSFDFYPAARCQDIYATQIASGDPFYK